MKGTVGKDMPNLEEHCLKTMKRYGVEGRDIHSWMDEPSREYAGSHRQFRHDSETIRLVGDLFGKTYGKSLAENIALDHIMADHEADIKRRNTTIIVNLPEQGEIPSIPCSYCGTLLKPSDQLCPKCGAARIKIIEQIDRAAEMEKLKLQEERKELRKELKYELKFKEMTPYNRMRLLEKYKRIAQRIGKDGSSFPEYRTLERLVSQDMEQHPAIKQKFDADVKRTISVNAILFLLFAFSFVMFFFEPMFLWVSMALIVIIVWRWLSGALKGN